ncbi:AbrB/MazE/SpoVT family DNA-binding domain-containing protein [Ramlibacter albus]|uniref:AbrB/MazE/SpoVT family DNA-binding domain-containing protein n=1 Tax=Ramlibacter albus TaxID=2079448 RepID=A0A923MCA2_9BURK|nr:AbrB/MazE/SpoVT family DNA-binding domain-containing protein [Ramlibacter albus]MBC5767335.1 AbrB/MazE/SpoVT family DNA-binding domain-containing protein [Ramlibacter albus]
MTTVTVSDKGQVVIPASIRRNLGIKPGTELEFELEGTTIRVNVRHNVAQSDIDSGFLMFRAKPSGGKRRLADFDVAVEMAKARSK